MGNRTTDKTGNHTRLFEPSALTLRAVRAAKDGGTISKIRIEIQWDLTQRWDKVSY